MTLSERLPEGPHALPAAEALALLNVSAATGLGNECLPPMRSGGSYSSSAELTVEPAGQPVVELLRRSALD